MRSISVRSGMRLGHGRIWWTTACHNSHRAQDDAGGAVWRCPGHQASRHTPQNRVPRRQAQNRCDGMCRTGGGQRLTCCGVCRYTATPGRQHHRLLAHNAPVWRRPAYSLQLSQYRSPTGSMRIQRHGACSATLNIAWSSNIGSASAVSSDAHM